MDNIDLILQREYAAKRAKAQKKAEANIRKARSVPAFVKLEKIEKELEFEIAKIKAEFPKSEQLKPLQELLKQLKLERAKLLKMMKLSESDLKPKYSCNKCFDTGFVQGKMCDCYKTRRTTQLVKLQGLDGGDMLDFDKFDIELISDPAQKEQMLKLKNYLQKWLKKYPNVKKRRLTICGGTGLGKTYISKCLAGELIKMGLSVCFLSAFAMNQKFLDFHTGKHQSNSNGLEALLYADVLVIDDLGTEPMLKNVTTNYLTLLLSERERLGKPVLVTTNLLPANIYERYDERIYSRLCSKQDGQVFHLSGQDLRLVQREK